MKKILLVLNENRLAEQVISTAIGIAGKSKSLLEAVFLNDIDPLSDTYPFPNDLNLTDTSAMDSISEDSIKLMQDMGKLVRENCDEAGIEYKIDIDKAVSIKELIILSQYSDVIITDSGSDLNNFNLAEILADAHCPLLLVPATAVAAEKLYLAYDGSASSMNAIKMFSYIFPEYAGLPAELFHIGGADMDGISHEAEIKVWASKHFSQLIFKLIAGNARKELVAYIKKDSAKSVLVLGAYSGSSIARLFLKNMAETVIQETMATIFITHK